jgi:hypothetical protein
MKKLFIALLIGIGFYLYLHNNPDIISSTTGEKTQTGQTVPDAYKNRQSDIQVSGSGEVNRILSDDNKGDRHQRFILRLSSGQTVLIAHNIDLAPKIKTLQKGDIVQFFGKYEWTAKGGIVHWTHHDPGGRHIGGWLVHKGRRYE